MRSWKEGVSQSGEVCKTDGNGMINVSGSIPM
jgi:hypothetical protein